MDDPPLKYLVGIEKPRKGSIVIDPFTGDGTMMRWLGNDNNNIKLMYDAEPSQPGVIRRNSLTVGIQWGGGFIVTCPPIKRKTEAEQEAQDANHHAVYDRMVYDQWGSDDLYKCFLKSILRSHTLGGVLVLPAEFLTSYRASDMERRRNFFKYYYIKRANLFTNEFLPNTKHLPLAIEFHRLTDYYAYHNSALENRLKTLTINVYPANKTVKYEYDIADHKSPLMDALRHLPTPPLKRRIQCRYLNIETQLQEVKPDDTVTDIGMHNTDIDNNPIHAANVNGASVKSLHPHRCVIKGVVSKKLQKRLVTDLNKIFNNWREETQSIYPTYIRHPKEPNTPLAQMNCRLVEKAVERLIYSYSLD